MKISVLTPSIRPGFLDRTQRCLEEQTFQDFEWLVCVGLRNRGFTLPSDYNRMLREAKGEVIVSLQDCITIPQNGLEQIAALDHSKTAYTYAIQKMEDGSYDWRKETAQARGTTELPAPNYWEIDLASASREMFLDIGGFDEAYNDGFSWDNVDVAYRAAAAGYKFHVSHATEGRSFNHDALIEHPFRNKKKNNDWRANETRAKAERGEYKLAYL